MSIQFENIPIFQNLNLFEARSFFIPLHTLPPSRSYQSYQISNAVKLYDKGINVPSHTTLAENDLKLVADAIKCLAQDV